jgi:hypothetical protein
LRQRFVQPPHEGSMKTYWRPCASPAMATHRSVMLRSRMRVQSPRSSRVRQPAPN